MSTDELPAFLRGCFSWHGSGLHWKHAPAFDLLSDEALRSTNPWIVVAAVAERAKHGDHRHAELLQPFFYQGEFSGLNLASLRVFASVAATEDLGMLEVALRSDDRHARRHAAEAALLTGQLSLAPAMLEAWHRAETVHEREMIGFHLSELLEPELGEIGEQVGIRDAEPPRAPRPDDPPAMVRLLEMRAKQARLDREDPAPFPGLVLAAYDALRAEHGDDAFVWRAEPLSVSRLVTDLLRAAEQGKRGAGRYIGHRQRLEVWTGTDCRALFHVGEAPLREIVAVLESLRESGELDRYVPGQRYFWGHLVPLESEPSPRDH